jgi:hypothetical protein
MVNPTDFSPTPTSYWKTIDHSGGEGKQLKGYDASQRTTASPTGGTVTAKALTRPGSHLPRMKPEKATPASYFQPVAEYTRSPKDRSY